MDNRRIAHGAEYIGRCELCGLVDHHLRDGACPNCWSRSTTTGGTRSVASASATGHAVETASGRIVDLLAPEPADIRLHDIVHALARLARYNGHTLGDKPYSVAQHSVWCARMAEEFLDATPIDCLYVLLHDAHEAYTGDIVSPLKAIPAIRRAIRPIEKRLQQAIHRALRLREPPAVVWRVIAALDDWAVRAEARNLTYSGGDGWEFTLEAPDMVLETIDPPMAPVHVEAMFMGAYARYGGHDEAWPSRRDALCRVRAAG